MSVSTRRPALEHLEQRQLPDASGFVSGLYRSFLHREPAPGEGAAHVQALGSGASQASVIRAFATSPEYQAGVVQRTFRELLHRDAEPGALAGFGAALRDGLTEDRLREVVLGSQEYFARHGGTAAGWLAGVYEDVLGRGLAPGEGQAWLDQLAGGRSREAVGGAIASTHEAHEQEVEHAFELELGRHADDTARASWTGLLDQGGHLRDLLEQVARSP